MIARARLQKSLIEGLARHPAVALLGPRQCGKTTLARQVSRAAGATFFDLENPDDVAALENPMLALEGLSGLVVLDEVQRRPELFPVLRVLMDRDEAPAKFLLLGSASPFLVRGVTESLAGRVAFIDLQGFLLDEVGAADLSRLWARGGFPRSFLAEDENSSHGWRRDFIRTFIEKDFSTLGLGTTPSSLGRLWQMAAHYHGQTLNASEIGRALGESYKTVQRHLELLEGAFMIRLLRPWFENLGKRLVKSPKLYVRDSGLFHSLLGIGSYASLLGNPKIGASWEGFALEQILARLPKMDAWFWGTQGGAELDLLIQPNGKRIGFEFKVADAPRMTKSLSIAQNDLGLDELLVVKPRGDGYPMEEKIRAAPLVEALEYCDAISSGGAWMFHTAG
ncbi:MAG: ATP-binding protein [Verrucomicrobia bacterium]|nr:ATP-binding protein [Verrucomicrobiota bacterium]